MIDDRELILEKTFQYVTKSGQSLEVVVLLFTDFILLARRKKNEQKLVLFKDPIPLETVVFIDAASEDSIHRIDIGSRRLFHIVHLRNEVHVLESFSMYEKSSWLQAAESARSMYCSLAYDIELAYLAIKLNRQKFMSPTRPYAESSRPFSFFRGKKAVPEEAMVEDIGASLTQLSSLEGGPTVRSRKSSNSQDQLSTKSTTKSRLSSFKSLSASLRSLTGDKNSSENNAPRPDIRTKPK